MLALRSLVLGTVCESKVLKRSPAVVVSWSGSVHDRLLLSVAETIFPDTGSTHAAKKAYRSHLYGLIL